MILKSPFTHITGHTRTRAASIRIFGAAFAFRSCIAPAFTDQTHSPIYRVVSVDRFDHADRRQSACTSSPSAGRAGSQYSTSKEPAAARQIPRASAAYRSSETPKNCFGTTLRPLILRSTLVPRFERVTTRCCRNRPAWRRATTPTAGPYSIHVEIVPALVDLLADACTWRRVRPARRGRESGASVPSIPNAGGRARRLRRGGCERINRCCDGLLLLLAHRKAAVERRDGFEQRSALDGEGCDTWQQQQNAWQQQQN